MKKEMDMWSRSLAPLFVPGYFLSCCAKRKSHRFCSYTSFCLPTSLLQTVCAYVLSPSVVPHSWQPNGLQPTRLLYPQNSPGKDTGVGNHFRFQRTFFTQGWNLGLLHCRGILYQRSPQAVKVTSYFDISQHYSTS